MGRPVCGRQTVTSGSLNVTYRLPMTRSALSPYVITGVGASHLACAGGVSCGGATRLGWNAGLGTRLTGLHLRTFVEVADAGGLTPSRRLSSKPR